jgi:hypothetical protein
MDNTVTTGELTANGTGKAKIVLNLNDVQKS